MPETLRIEACASRDKAKAEEFASRFDIPKAYGSYEELYEDSDIDLIYIATPHSHHKQQMIAALEHGRNVLSEKAFTVNEKEAKEVFDLAKDKELCALFRHKPALEPRAAAFYIREEKLSRFEALFHERFGNAFELLRQQDVIQQRVFGPGIMERHLAEFTGDYLAVANTPLSFTYGKKAMKAHHAGGMEEELMIPLILYPQRRKDVYNETNEKNRNCMDMHSAFACDGMHEE